MQNTVNNHICHISIDDVANALQALSKSEHESIFEVKTFWYILILHRLFGLKITLYVYAKDYDWTLADIPEKYKHELEEASGW